MAETQLLLPQPSAQDHGEHELRAAAQFSSDQPPSSNLDNQMPHSLSVDQHTGTAPSGGEGLPAPGFNSQAPLAVGDHLIGSSLANVRGIPRSYPGRHRQNGASPLGYLGKHRSRNPGVGPIPLGPVSGSAVLAQAPGQGGKPAPVAMHRKEHSPLAWLIDSGAQPGAAKEMLFPHKTTVNKAPRIIPRPNDQAEQGIRTQPTKEQTAEAGDADRRLAAFAQMESGVQAGGRLPTRDEVYSRLFPGRQVGRHRKEDVEAVDAAMARLENVENGRLAAAVKDFAEEGRTPSEQELMSRLYPGRQPEQLTTDELRDINIATQNISETKSVHNAIIDEYSSSVQTGGRVPSFAEVSKRLFPHKHDELTFAEKMDVDNAVARLMSEKADSVTKEFVDRGKTPPERDVSQKLFGTWYPGHLPITEKWTVARVMANISDRVAQPLPPDETTRRKSSRIARVAGAVAMAVSMAATNIFGVQTGITHPSVGAPVVATRMSQGVSGSRQTTSQPR